jgi:putative oxidoreductase
MKVVPLLGRILFVIVFLHAVPAHFSHGAAAYAASAGMPMASIAVPISGVLALLGGLSILLGYKAKIGAWLIVLFLVPVTLMMHRFWTVSDPMMHMMQQVNFLKNTAMLGGALMIAYFGSGPLSIDSSTK